MFRKARSQSSWRNKLMCFFAEPAWAPAEGFPSQPAVASSASIEPKQPSSASVLVKLSGLLMTVISACFLVLYLGTQQELSASVQIFIAGFAVVVFAGVGAFWTKSVRSVVPS
jgi:hypothetical protein